MDIAASVYRLVAIGASCLIHVALTAGLVTIGLNVAASRTPSVVMAELVPSEPQRPVERPAPPTPSRLPARLEPPSRVETPENVEPRTIVEAPDKVAAPASETSQRTQQSAELPATTDIVRKPEAAGVEAPQPEVSSAAPGTTAMAIPSGITQTAIPRGGYQVRPSYPGTARRLGIQGTTTLRIFVDVDGRVTDIVVEQSAGHADLDHAAADAVRRWRFEPARRGAEAVGMWVLLPVEFRLR
jgi:protein TonB